MTPGPLFGCPRACRGDVNYVLIGVLCFILSFLYMTSSPRKQTFTPFQRVFFCPLREFFRDNLLQCSFLYFSSSFDTRVDLIDTGINPKNVLKLWLLSRLFLAESCLHTTCCSPVLLARIRGRRRSFRGSSAAAPAAAAAPC